MKPLSRTITTSLLILSFPLISGCSDDNPTNPGGGGGGGGSTLTPFNSGLMPKGRSFQMTFATEGTAPYVCGVHPLTMFGNRVTVSNGAPVDSALVSIVSNSTPGFNPSQVTIRPNGYVRWVNVHAMTHSVESR